MNIARLENLLETRFFALNRSEMDEMGDSFYFFYLMIYSKNYNSQNERKAILIWIDKNKIEESRNFSNGLSSFVNNLNYVDYDKVISFIERKPKEALFIEQFSTQVEILQSKKNDIINNKKDSIEFKKNRDEKVKKSTAFEKVIPRNNNELKLRFLDWIGKEILNKYQGNSKSELVYQEEFHLLIKELTNKIEKSKLKDNSTDEKKLNSKLTTKISTQKINTLKRYKSFVDYYKELTVNSNTSHLVAVKLVCEKFGIAEKTLTRAFEKS